MPQVNLSSRTVETVWILQGVDGVEDQIVTVTGPDDALDLLREKLRANGHVPVASTESSNFKIAAVPVALGIGNDGNAPFLHYFAGAIPVIEHIVREAGYVAHVRGSLTPAPSRQAGIDQRARFSESWAFSFSNALLYGSLIRELDSADTNQQSASGVSASDGTTRSCDPG